MPFPAKNYTIRDHFGNPFYPNAFELRYCGETYATGRGGPDETPEEMVREFVKSMNSDMKAGLIAGSEIKLPVSVVVRAARIGVSPMLETDWFTVTVR